MERVPAVNLPPVVLWLGLILAAVQAIRHFVSGATDHTILLTFAFIPSRYGADVALLPGGEGARIWTPITHAFLHGDILHLVVNVVWMVAFGTPLARRFGAVRFLALSMASAVAGAGLFYVLHPTDQVLLVGASGAVSGMMAGTARFAFSPNGPLAGGKSPAAFRVPAEPLLSAFRNRRVAVFVLVWFVVNILFGFSSGFVAGISSPIAWEAHIGGFLVGLLCFPLLDPVRDGDPVEKLES